jgi:RHS repeat-associated protein
MEVLHAHCAGLNIHKETVVACVRNMSGGKMKTEVRTFASMTGYLYDADGTRVAKGFISAWSCDPTANGFSTTNDYILGLGGEQLTEMGMGGATSGGGTTKGLVWQHANIWAGGKLLGTYDKDGLHFYLDDPLGTRRAQTDAAGVLEQTCSSLPFGDGLACSGGDLLAPTENHFTGKERDSESGNDYFGARYYASSMGRFMSPDWSAKEEPVPYAKLGDPQTLNLYAYVGNNPLSRVDVDGHDLVIYYSRGKDLTPADNKWLDKNENAVLDGIKAKYEKAGVKNVVLRPESSLTKSQLNALKKSTPFGVARLIFTENYYPGIGSPTNLGWLGYTHPDGTRNSAIFMGGFQKREDASCNWVCLASNVGAHELGHGQGLQHPNFYLESLREMFGGAPDLMGGGQGYPKQSEDFLKNDKQVQDMVNGLNKIGDMTPK